MTCQECGMTVCSSRCPLNDKDPEPVLRCDHCGGPIFAGEYYLDIEGEAWCEECQGKAYRVA